MRSGSSTIAAFRSAPEQNEPPEPVSTTASTDDCFSGNCSSASANASSMARLSALRDVGRFI
ncbi:MAG: hypothetical protein U0165_09240 [Polyangiaceae bacterium]